MRMAIPPRELSGVPDPSICRIGNPATMWSPTANLFAEKRRLTVSHGQAVGSIGVDSIGILKPPCAHPEGV
jgi:hypothetical protein